MVIRKISLFCLFFVIAIPPVYAQQSVTLNTYYPAPFGAYDRLRLVPRTTPPPCDTTLEGSIYYDDNLNVVTVCQDDGTWGFLHGVWSKNNIDASNAQVYLTDQARNTKVGIGTATPLADLHVRRQGLAQFFAGTSPGEIHLENPGIITTNSKITFSSGASTNSIAAIGASTEARGSMLLFGTSNDLPAGVNNAALVIGPDGHVGVRTSPKFLHEEFEVEGASLFNGPWANIKGVDIDYLVNSGRLLVGWNRLDNREADFITNRQDNGGFGGASSSGGFSFMDIDGSSIINPLVTMMPTKVSIGGLYGSRVGIGRTAINPQANLHISHEGGALGPAAIILENRGTLDIAQITLAVGTAGARRGYIIRNNDGVPDRLQFLSFDAATPGGTPVIAFRPGLNEILLNDRVIARGNTTDDTDFALRAENSASQNLLTVRNDGNVGIGTTAPIENLSIDGGGANVAARININNGSAGLAWLRLTETSFRGGFLRYDNASNDFHIGVHDPNNTNVANDVVALTIDRGTANVGIGTTAPAFRLDVNGIINGNCYYDSGAFLIGACVSDISLKENIHPLSNSLDKITRLKPVNFDFIDPKYGRGRQTGLIAQDVEKVFPEWVSVSDDDKKRIFYGMQIPMHLIQAVKELKAENDELRAQNEQLRAEFEVLKKRFN